MRWVPHHLVGAAPSILVSYVSPPLFPHFLLTYCVFPSTDIVNIRAEAVFLVTSLYKLACITKKNIE